MIKRLTIKYLKEKTLTSHFRSVTIKVTLRIEQQYFVSFRPPCFLTEVSFQVSEPRNCP